MNHLKSDLAKPILYFFSVMCALSFSIKTAGAHGVSVFAWVEGDRVYVESKFSGGKKVKAGKIIVTDSQGTELLTGTTDENGEFSFKVPKKTELKIVLLAGTGHRAEWTIAAGEIDMPATEKKPVPEKSSLLKGIIIGIGCIFSLTGITAYIRKRKKKNETMKTQKSKS
jgi:nickel transport protein